MYEKFTVRARKVMALANQEAQRFNHDYIGTEHILLGLAKEGAGAGAIALKKVDVDLAKVRIEVEKLVKSGRDMVTQGKLPPWPRAKMVIEYAIEEARNLSDNYVGTEHLLLGLLRDESSTAAKVLSNLGVNLNQFRADILTMIESAPPESDSSHNARARPDIDISPPVNGPDAIRVWQYARAEARMLGQRRVGGGHLLLGLLRDEAGIGATILAELGVNLEALRERIIKRIGELPGECS